MVMEFITLPRNVIVFPLVVCVSPPCSSANPNSDGELPLLTRLVEPVAVIARDPSPCTPPDSSSDIELRLPDRKPSLRLPQADGKLPEYGPVQIHHLFRED